MPKPVCIFPFTHQTKYFKYLHISLGIAQRHSSLFFKSRQRLPGTKPGQIYSYPVSRWRKARRQYLTNPRPFGKVREIEYEEHLDNSSSLGAGDTDSKDSKDNRDEVPREWYEDMEMHDLDNFDEPEPDSDGDYEGMMKLFCRKSNF